jgi:hypothetical protein
MTKRSKVEILDGNDIQNKSLQSASKLFALTFSPQHISWQKITIPNSLQTQNNTISQKLETFTLWYLVTNNSNFSLHYCYWLRSTWASNYCTVPLFRFCTFSLQFVSKSLTPSLGSQSWPRLEVSIYQFCSDVLGTTLCQSHRRGSFEKRFYLRGGTWICEKWLL